MALAVHTVAVLPCTSNWVFVSPVLTDCFSSTIFPPQIKVSNQRQQQLFFYVPRQVKLLLLVQCVQCVSSCRHHHGCQRPPCLPLSVLSIAVNDAEKHQHQHQHQAKCARADKFAIAAPLHTANVTSSAEFAAAWVLERTLPIMDSFSLPVSPSSPSPSSHHGGQSSLLWTSSRSDGGDGGGDRCACVHDEFCAVQCLVQR